jgi:5-oxopent-3-ene-1,2,5-tricarboxylate decarboxylase/2-hydroxyhepta-2,4-diene-1,7-dioate isomerase
VVAARIGNGTLLRLDSLAADAPDDPLALLDEYGVEGLLAWATRLQEDGKATGLLVREDEVVFEPPVGRCSKLVCVALNYHAHAVEGDFQVPVEPVIFFKPSTTLVGHDQPVICPPRASRLDYEVELGVVIGKSVTDLPAERWQEAVAGYTILNDVTARDLQLRAMEANAPWDRSKGFDTFAPLGPYLVTPDEVGDPHELDLEVRIGDRVLQSSNTRHMIFRIPELLEDISAGITLERGDVIGTGTPDGIGPAEHGEVMEATISALGTLRSPVVFAAERVPTSA